MNTAPYNDLAYMVSPHSDSYTTAAGGTMELFIWLNRAPSDGTVVRFSVTTSDPATAYIVYGNTLVFTPENWYIGIPVLVQGTYQANYSNTSWADKTNAYESDYNVDIRFLETNDEDFSGHIRTTSWQFTNKPETDYIDWFVADHSNDYTTTSGSKMELWVVLTKRPANHTTVKFGVSTSDPTKAIVLGNSFLVFTTDNWNIPVPVSIQGVYNSEQGSYDVEITLLGSDDPT